MLVIGSQSILAALPEDALPTEATASIEADVAFFDDPDDVKADHVDGAIGELSPFHERYGYYAQGVSVSTGSKASRRDQLPASGDSKPSPGHPAVPPRGVSRPGRPARPGAWPTAR